MHPPHPLVPPPRLGCDCIALPSLHIAPMSGASDPLLARKCAALGYHSDAGTAALLPDFTELAKNSTVREQGLHKNFYLHLDPATDARDSRTGTAGL
eukprot:6828867-Pyramimonas_sp.AAC.3